MYLGQALKRLFSNTWIKTPTIPKAHLLGIRFPYGHDEDVNLFQGGLLRHSVYFIR